MAALALPKFVLFDFGGTLFDDGVYDNTAGFEALRRAAKNPEACTADEMNSIWETQQEMIARSLTKENRLEQPLSAMLRSITTRLGLEFDIPLHEQEFIFDMYNSPRQKTPGISDFLALLRAKGVKTAVISNITMSGASLSAAVSHLIPEAEMEFVLTSADFLIGKPAPDLFLAAAKLLKTDPENCWYCGNDAFCDVGGAHAGGMLPFFYNTLAKKTFEE